MTEVIAMRPTLSDSTFKTRPHFQTYMKSDASLGGNSVQQIEAAREKRQMKFPSLVGRQEVDSFRDPQRLTDTGYKKWNDEGEHRPPAPVRSCDNTIDPVSGFVSVAGDQVRGTGPSGIPCLVQLNDTPQSIVPQQVNSVRIHHQSAPPCTMRASEYDPGVSASWNSRHVSDAALRAGLGGWTSNIDPRKEEELKARGEQRRTPADENAALRDKLSNKYMYTSSTQRAYGEVPWDNVLQPRQWAPVSTLEVRPDQISQCFNTKRAEAAANEYQRVGRSWDWFQSRKGHYKTNIPIPGIVFCSPCPRSQQIPLYGGCIGGVNLDELDNPDVRFQPLTVKRVPIPRPSEVSHRPNIPGYEGCTQYRNNTAPAMTNISSPRPQTSYREHREMPSTPSTPEHKRDSQMSRMVTTVPPCNPYNKIDTVIPTI